MKSASSSSKAIPPAVEIARDRGYAIELDRHGVDQPGEVRGPDRGNFDAGLKTLTSNTAAAADVLCMFVVQAIQLPQNGQNRTCADVATQINSVS